MPLAPRSRILLATMILSLLIHGIVLLAMSLRRAPEVPKLRTVAQVDVVRGSEVPVHRQKPKKIPPRPLTRPVVKAGHEGTRPGVGGDPAPAPLSLKLDLPQTAPRARDPKGLRLDRSVAGDPRRGNPFGDPKGVPGGVGSGGSGPGGTGGGGDGGFAMEPTPPAPAPDAPVRLQNGTIFCTGCHNTRTQPLNIERLALDRGWDVRGGEPPPGAGPGVVAEFEYLLDPDGHVDKVVILQNSTDPEEAEALTAFAAMHEFTPPGMGVKVRVRYRWFPDRVR